MTRCFRLLRVTSISLLVEKGSSRFARMNTSGRTWAGRRILPRRRTPEACTEISQGYAFFAYPWIMESKWIRKLKSTYDGRAVQFLRGTWDRQSVVHSLAKEGCPRHQ